MPARCRACASASRPARHGRRQRRPRVSRRPLERGRPDPRRRGRGRERPRARLPAPAVRARGGRAALSRSALGRPEGEERLGALALGRAARRRGDADDLAALRRMVVRYAEQSEAFALRLFPHYRGQLRRGNTSFRPTDVDRPAAQLAPGRHPAARRRLPVEPDAGHAPAARVLQRQPAGRPRRWRVGEPFEAHARRYLGAIGQPLPGSAWLLATLGITKRRRTEYDHVMLQLHDRAKADLDFQRSASAGTRSTSRPARPGSSTATRCCTRRWAGST